MNMFWPFTLPERASQVALVIIDMQVDFCAPGGWVDQLGEDISNTRAVIPAVAQALDVARHAGMAVFHTREGHLPDLSDLPANKQWRTRVHGLGIGDEGNCGRILVRGEPGFEIVPELAPVAGEVVIDKPGKSAFHTTDFERQLKTAGVTHLVITGVTSDCCVQSTFRDGFERGYECVILEDCTAAVEERNHEATMDILKAFGGRWGNVATLAEFGQTSEDFHA
ncbi:cysteine hydrolase family protein [Roseibium aggregatum]|uniref:Peroxyureidoacrylate/ureidoacrylate amidohydrolase RutB n=1 Tax=Roseibium aggregatum TaxID=187304 RepID=A0A0M6YF35_9HYPH|nr:isochorismatase family cysteine hydrolase [Roseibium aggregatum]CTQ47430.1 Peroxyureidoacrylate/ureidoacrylate amidohydrolase RutB [Roseibium aggregatum]